MAISRRPLDVDNYSALDGGTGLAIPGYYSRVNLNDVINNFIIAYIGDGKILSKVPRYEVAFWAQRSVQEFSYDILHAEKTIEVELNSTLQMSLPSDYVNYVNISFLDNFGNLKTIQPSRATKATRAVTQDEDYKYLYDNDGRVVFKETSDTLERFQSTNKLLTAEEAADYYNGYYNNDDYSYFGRRYGSEPQNQNFNGSYVLDLEAGRIFFDSSFKQGSIIALRYISDGIGDNNDFNNVLIPKLAEDAIYASILYNLAKLRSASAGASGLYKKEASAKMRNAKIRLSNMKTEEMAQVLRGKSKWIKH